MLSIIRNKLSHYTWVLAYGKYDESTVEEDLFKRGWLHYVKNPYKDKWFADPFILDDSKDILTLLVEEFDSGIKKGRIARITIDKNTDTIAGCSIVLELPTHLSFPAIYRYNGKIYVHPENSASGVSTIYEYDMVEDKLKNPTVLVNEPLTDAIIKPVENYFVMYSTQYPTSCGNILTVYQSDSFLGLYNKIDDIAYKDRTARMAGAFLEHKGRELRPAQDCNLDYGEAVVFYDGLKVYGELRPKNFRYEGIHTFNKLDNTFIIDLKKYDYALIHGVLKRIVRLFK